MTPADHPDGIRLWRIGPAHLRLGTARLWVDILEHPRGAVRVGALPDLVKALDAFGLNPPIVVVPPRRVTLDGDNWTGEEFIGWATFFGRHAPKTYVGQPATLDAFHGWLGLTLPWWFDDACLRVVKMSWMDDHLLWRPIETSGTLPNGLTIAFEADRIRLWDRSRLIHDLPVGPPEPSEPPRKERAEEWVPPLGLRIICLGSGNGLAGRTAAFVMAWGDRMLLLDPPARPHHLLARVGVPWSAITDILVTHNHEDHILGLTAILETSRREGRRLRLVTSRSILETLTRQMVGLWSDLRDLVEWVSLEPGTPLAFGGAILHARRNHHILPYDTLGRRIEYRECCLGFSGDTKFDRHLNRILARPELGAGWLEDCDLVLHEAHFGDPGFVHTHIAELEAMQAELPGEIWLYHCPHPYPSRLPLITEFAPYDLAQPLSPFGGYHDPFPPPPR